MIGDPRPRLLVIGPLPPPPGGGETVTHVLIHSALRERYDLHHFDTSRRRSKEDMGRITLGNARDALRIIARLRRTLAELRPNLVHLPLSSPRGAVLRDRWLAHLVRRSGAALVLHSHAGAMVERYERSGPLWQRFVRSLLAQGNALVCLSPKWQRFFDGLGVGVETTVIPNPMDPEFAATIESARTRAASASAEESPAPTVLFVGAVCHPKGVPELMRAVDAISDAHPRLELRIVGDRQYPGHYEQIEALRSSLAARDRIHLLGPKYGDDLAREYAAANILALPSHFEGTPMVIVEAMTAGLPIVASRVGGIPDMVESGVNGVLVEPRDVDGLGAALARLLEDGDLQQQMGDNARARALERHAASRFAEALGLLYDRVLAP